MNLTSLISYYTYFLAVQKCKKNDNYSIHGLWIDYNKGGYPVYCNMTDKFDIIELNEFKYELDEKWYSCYGKSETLWEHEWDKHGTCFYPKMNLKYYFNKTLELYNQKQDYMKEKCTEKECLIPIEFIEL